MLNRYPAGRFAERAAWKAGWWAYRQGQFSDALQYFDKGAEQFPRSDYRPSWLYWSAAPRSRPATSKPASRACA
jgi:TolA-binding protein